jgi:DNA recombination protein RmuC
LANARAEVALLADQRQGRVEDVQQLKDSFSALGADALRANNEAFLNLATRSLQTVLVEAKGDVEKKQQAIDALIRPMREVLEKHQVALIDIEKKREVAYRGLEEQIKVIAGSHAKLEGTTDRLATALRRPEQRGRWGEMQLRNAVEMAGMTEHCDFTEQPQTDDQDTRDRPDMIVHMPGRGVIVIDSKVALDAYLDALLAGGDTASAMQRHAEQVEKHYRKLATKRYWDQFEDTPKLVVMFMPMESALVAALEVKPDLHADAMDNHVLIATPTLLVALLRAVAYGWQQEDLATNARKIANTGSELYSRLKKFVEHFTAIGRSIESAGKSFDEAVGSLESRLLPAARELRDLHATTEEPIEKPLTLQVETRQISAAELKN